MGDKCYNCDKPIPSEAQLLSPAYKPCCDHMRDVIVLLANPEWRKSHGVRDAV